MMPEGTNNVFQFHKVQFKEVPTIRAEPARKFQFHKVQFKVYK